MGGLGNRKKKKKKTEAVCGCPEGVARRSLRELILACVRNYQVITDDLHLKEGTVERKDLYFYEPLPG